MKASRWYLAFALGSALAVTGCVQTSQSSTESHQQGQGSASAQPAESEFPQRVYWGDTHLHTANSVDAFGLGARITPEEALRFARGEEVTSSTGPKARLSRPLDFLVIADHSEGLGATKALYDTPRDQIKDGLFLRWHDWMHEGIGGSLRAMTEMLSAAAGSENSGKVRAYFRNPEREKSIWLAHLKTVERYNEPGKFTAFMGFEYTLMDRGNNLHRNVIFRDGYDEVSTVMPAGPAGRITPDHLWDYMDAYERATGGKVLAIPHNANLSNGLMFELTQPGGGPMSAGYARRRAAHEPLVEITQIKGDSESHPFLSPNDEFAAFGDAGWEINNLLMKQPKTPDMFAGEYVREALKRGLLIEQRTGENPYRLGVLGSTDSHTGLTTADEDNWFGKHSDTEPRAKRATDMIVPVMPGGRIGWHYLASGYAAVWARANSRAALFDAMMRREIYGTTGPRMTVRFFGGWDFGARDLKGDWVRAGYLRGVPMGGKLKPAASGRPSFIVSALKDPQGANLDRAQIVKGWVDAAGKAHERVFDIVWSSPDKRRLTNGKLPAVGDTVDLRTATYSNRIGAPSLATVWTDPGFDPKQRAFYYVRVIEIPTPSWPAYDAVRYKVKLPPEVRVKQQERAYTSAIWYVPS
jgi:hypothetical protein